MKKKGISPVIATVILIAIVIILSIVIFLWARGFVAEKAIKFDRAVEFACDDVNFESGVFQNTGGECGGATYSLDILNRGNVPLYGFEIKTIEDEGATVKTKNLPATTITIGESHTICLTDSAGDVTEPGDQLLIVPIILGETDTGRVAFTCPDTLGFTNFVP